MTRTLFQIVLVLVGLIIGSLASISTNMIPSRVEVISNQDVHVKFYNMGSFLSSVTMNSGSILPVHYTGTAFYFSPTLSMDDLTKDGATDNTITSVRQVMIDKATENAYLQCQLEITGDDAVNDAIRVAVISGTHRYLLSPDEPTVLTDVKLGTSAISVQFVFFYELDDESITIDNINNAEGSNVKVNLYVNVQE